MKNFITIKNAILFIERIDDTGKLTKTKKNNYFYSKRSQLKALNHFLPQSRWYLLSKQQNNIHKEHWV